MEFWRTKTKVMLIILIFFIFLFVLFLIIGIATKNTGLYTAACGFFFGSFPVFIIFCVLANNDSKIKKRRDERPYIAGSYRQKPNDKEKVEEEVAMMLAEKFDNAVRVHYSELPLPKYCVPEDVWDGICNSLHNKSMLENYLKDALTDMERHLGIAKGNGSKLMLCELNERTAGDITKHLDKSNVIRVDYNNDYSPSTYISILSHELSHAYQYRQNKEIIFEGIEIEQFTDILTMYLGFGPYMMAGKEGRNYSVGYVKKMVLEFAAKNVETLREDRMKQSKIDEENKKIENEINRIKGILQIYVGSFQNRVYELSVMPISDENKMHIEQIVYHFGTNYFKNIATRIGYPRSKTPEENKSTVEYLQEELSLAIKALETFSNISKR